MNHQDYIRAIEREQTLIRRLFVSRKRRAEAIEKITVARYSHLIGRFFTKKNDPEVIYQIKDVFVRANYAMSDQVDVVISCECIGVTTDGDNHIRGLYIHYDQITMNPLIDIDEHLTGRFVSYEVALERFDKLVQQLKDNLGL